MERTAQISKCGRYRWTLTRKWDDRPRLLVVMFNPSTADAEVDDPTIRSLCHRASRWGYGSIRVVNLLPLRSPTPDAAAAMADWEHTRDWLARDALIENASVLEAEAARSADILLAYGALADRIPDLRDGVLEDLRSVNVPIYCLGRTASGAPIHPLARGRNRVPDDAPLVPWQ